MSDMHKDSRSLLEAARGARPDDATRRRIRAGLDARLAMLAAAGVGAGVAAGASSAAATSAAATAAATAATEGGAAGAAATTSAVATAAVATKASLLGFAVKIGLAVGLVTAAGAGVRAVVIGASPAETSQQTQSAPAANASASVLEDTALAAAAPTTAPAASEQAAVEEPTASAEPVAASSARTTTEGAARRDAASIAAEVALLRQAQASLREGDSAASLQAIDSLAAKHPDGALREERDVARVLALCAAGRVDDARVAALRFLSRWPRSVHAQRVRASCAFSQGAAPKKR